MKKILFLAFAGTLSMVSAQVAKNIPEFNLEEARKEAVKKGVPSRVMEEYLSGQKYQFDEKNKIHINEPRIEQVTIAEVGTNRVINQSVFTSLCQNSDLSLNNYFNWTGETATSCNPGTTYPVATWLGNGINGNNGSPIQLNNSPCNNTTGFQVIHNQPIGALSTNAATAFANGYDDNCKNPSTGFYDLSCTPSNGTNSIRLSSAYNNYTCAKLVYPVTVTSSNTQFTYQFAVVIDDGGHPVGEQPSFLFGMKDINGNLITGVNANCVQYNIDATGASSDTSYLLNSLPCFGGTVYYRKWHTVTIDLTSQIGNTIYATFEALDCPWSGHYAYAYISATCGNLTASVSGFCGGQGSATMQAPGGFANYQWYGPNNTIPIAGATSSVYTANPAQNGDVFTVDCITLQGCTTKLQVTVSASNILATGITGPTCRGGSNGSASVSVTGGTQYSYLWTPSGNTTTSISGQPAGNVAVTVHDLTGNCPDTTLALNIAQINPPLQTAVDTMCGTYIVLSAPTTGPYTWYDNSDNVIGGATSSSYTVNPGAGGQHYTVTYHDPVTGCLDSLKKTLTQINISFSQSPSAPCNGGTNGSITVTGSGGNTFPLYDWNMTGTTTGSGTNVAFPPPLVISGLPQGNFTVAINPTGNSTCTFTMAIQLIAGQIPAPTLDTLKGCALDNISVPTNTVAGNTHNWYNGSTSLGNSYPYTTTGVTQGAVYTDTIRNVFGCISVYKAFLKLRKITPTITSPEGIHCHDDSSGKIKVTLAASGVTNGPITGPVIFNWNFPNPYTDPAPITTSTSLPQTSQQNNLHAGTYTVVVTAGGCVATKTLTLVNPALLPDDSLFTYYCPKDSLVWLYAEAGHSSYTWLNNGVPVNPVHNNDSIQLTPTTVGNYQVVYLVAGCRDTARILFTFPSYHAFRPDKITNIFTPNADKRNDNFYPFFDANVSQYEIDKQMEEYSIVIYNRWGKKIFEADQYQRPWDGKDESGTPQDDGTYYWILRYKSNCSTKADIVEKHGFVQLLR